MAFSAMVAQAAEKLYVYNWTEYVPSSLLEQFTKETGIEVIYSTFESNEEMYSKLKLSNSKGYDCFSIELLCWQNDERRYAK